MTSYLFQGQRVRMKQDGIWCLPGTNSVTTGPRFGRDYVIVGLPLFGNRSGVSFAEFPGSVFDAAKFIPAPEATDA